MSVKVRVSPLLRKFTNGQEIVEVTGYSPIECLHNLEAEFPGMRRWLYDKRGKLRPQVWFFVKGERIDSNDLTSPINEGDELYVMLAIGGG